MSDPITIYNTMKAQLSVLTLEAKLEKLAELECLHMELTRKIREIEVQIACISEELR